ncbi:MAG: hypothetical protein ACRDWH_01615 [Acidimicrobiia bacterium]
MNNQFQAQGNGIWKSMAVLAGLVGLGVFMQRRRRNRGLRKAIQANWKEVKKKLPDDWADFAPKKRKEAARLIDTIHRSTGQSRRRIRRTLHGLTAS